MKMYTLNIFNASKMYFIQPAVNFLCPTCYLYINIAMSGENKSENVNQKMFGKMYSICLNMLLIFYLPFEHRLIHPLDISEM